MKFFLIILIFLTMLFVSCSETSSKVSPPAPQSTNESAQSSSQENTAGEQSDSSSLSVDTSGTSIGAASENDDDLLRHADILTYNLITYSFNKSVLEGNPPNKLGINSFILTVPTVEESDYMYKELVAQEELYEYPKKSVEQIAFEVFGEDSWVLEGGDTEYDESREVYTSSLAFGIGGGISCKDIFSTLSSDAATITSQFTLLDTAPNGSGPEWRENGKYQIVFSIIQDNDRNYLRFLKVEKI